MSADDNVKVIQQVYEAFGRGDVVAIQALVADDVDWASEAASSAAPWYGVHRGKDGIAAFFTEFGTAMEVEDFTPTSFAANESEVHTIVRHRSRSRATGRTVSMDLHHYFRFENGKIAYYRGSEDTAQTEAALNDRG